MAKQVKIASAWYLLFYGAYYYYDVISYLKYVCKNKQADSLIGTKKIVVNTKNKKFLVHGIYSSIANCRSPSTNRLESYAIL